MDPLSNLSQVIETLRRQVNTGAPAGKRPASSSTATGATSSSGAPVRAGIADLQRTIRDKVRGLDAGDAQQRRRAVRIMLENVLRWEFGDHLVNDPAFHDMLADVQKTMEGDARLNEDLTSLVRQLAKTGA